MTAEAPTRQPAPMRTCGPIVACGPTIVPAPIWAAGCTIADGSISGAVGHQPEQQLAFGDDLVVQVRRRLREGERGPPASERDLEAKAVARDDLATELRVVDPAQVHSSVGGRVAPLEQEQGRHLRQRLEHQDAGHERGARKMALEELFVDGDVLDGDQPASGLVRR